MPDWIQLLKHSSVCLQTKAGQHVYIEPWQVPDGLPRAAVIAITHPHHDHCSPDDVKKLSGPDTVILAPAAAAKALRDNGVTQEIRTCAPGESAQAGPVRGLAVEAYNVNKWRSPGTPFHPRSADFMGWVLEMDRGRVYHAGDTDVIPPEVRPPIDVAFVPVSGKYVATAEEAAELVNRLRPGLAIPMHWGAIVGAREDAERFQRLAQVPVEILG